MGLNNIREKKSHEIRIIVAAAGIAVFLLFFLLWLPAGLKILMILQDSFFMI